jgi:hypothetical protein
MSRLPNWLRAGVMTAFYAAVVPFCLSLLSWLEEVAEWAAGEPVSFPDISVIRRAFVALVIAVLAGGVNAAVRYVQERNNLGSPPVYPKTQH